MPHATFTQKIYINSEPLIKLYKKAKDKKRLGIISLLLNSDFFQDCIHLEDIYIYIWSS